MFAIAQPMANSNARQNVWNHNHGHGENIISLPPRPPDPPDTPVGTWSIRCVELEEKVVETFGRDETTLRESGTPKTKFFFFVLDPNFSLLFLTYQKDYIFFPYYSNTTSNPTWPLYRLCLIPIRLLIFFLFPNLHHRFHVRCVVVLYLCKQYD